MLISEASILPFVTESNRIEGIHWAPTKGELNAHLALLAHDAPDIGAVAIFVQAVAGKPLRDQIGMNVRVGNHLPPPGGPGITIALTLILKKLRSGGDPYAVHQEYETLHPFMDGNGRSGRALWLWQMIHQKADPYVLERCFLHTWYYQSLSNNRG